jgi:hypothetical protein
MGGNIPVELALRLKKFGNIENFIETGTYEGATTRWATQHFDGIITIEKSLPLYQNAIECLHPQCPEVLFLLGDSRESLQLVVKGLTAPAMFWLDAHFSGENTAGVDDECPVLGELAEIMRSNIIHYILIDDAGMFTRPVPPPHKQECWPSYAQVETMLQEHDYVVRIIGDVIVAVPEEAKGQVY